jgi:integrase
MARKRTTRNKKGEGNYWYDKKNRRHTWILQHKGERHRIADCDEAQARVRFEELKRKVLGGMNVEGSQQLLRTYLPTYINTEVTGKQSTRDDYHKRADLYILPTLGDIRLCDLKRQMIVAWVTGMVNVPDEKGKYWAFSSIKQALSLLRRALQVAVPELLEHNPAADVKAPTRRKGDEFKIDDTPVKAKIFTLEQMTAFLVEVERTNKRHGLAVYYVLLSELGPRRGEGLGLRRRDIDFQAKTIRIAQQVTRNPMTNETAITTPKSEAGKRDLPVSDSTILLLREQCMRVGAMRPESLVFPGKDGKQRQPNSVTQHFRRLCRRLGYDGYTLHSLRKFAVTDWRASGMDLEVAAAMAGDQATGVTANIYSIATMERKRAALEKRNAE